MAIFPLAPDQTIAQMWSNGVWGGQSSTTPYTALSHNHLLPIHNASLWCLALYWLHYQHSAKTLNEALGSKSWNVSRNKMMNYGETTIRYNTKHCTTTTSPLQSTCYVE